MAITILHTAVSSQTNKSPARQGVGADSQAEQQVCRAGGWSGNDKGPQGESPDQSLDRGSSKAPTCHHANVGLNGAEWEVRGLGLAVLAQCIEHGGLHGGVRKQ